MFGYYVHDLSPFLVEFGNGWGIRYYGMAYVAGFLAWFYGLVWFRHKGWSALTDSQVSELLFYTVVGVLVGGRLGYCLLYDWAETLRNPVSIIAFWNGGLRGMASHGGIAGALMGFLLWARKARLDGWAVADRETPRWLGFFRANGFCQKTMRATQPARLAGAKRQLPDGRGESLQTLLYLNRRAVPWLN